MQFKISKKSNKSQARLGFLETENGVVETPCLVGVATQAAVKTLTSEEALQAKSQMLICNTFHLHLKPGQDIVAKAGGLHDFMNWKKPLMTDSGGFQVFSLGFGRDYGMGKVLSAKGGSASGGKVVEAGAQPSKIKITDDGVFFRSPVDGAELFLGPKESIKIQEKLGADIIFAFDECTSPIADYEYTKNSLQKTHKWAKICLKAKKSDQALFGIVQGGKFKDLREQSAKFIGGLDFDGFGIGGEFGDDKSQMANMIGWCLQELPEKKPRHLLGIGYLEDMEQIIKAGIDTFDCTVPTHYARHGIAFTKEGKLDLNKSQFLKDREPLDSDCMCFVCQNYKRNYISHLLKAREITALKLLTFHNLFYFNTFAEKLRQEIKNGKI
jgi:queuine tRNA-ribosyltransferase/7-cyano-7-deazaguanine tRNA-ribosyltransferase